MIEEKKNFRVLEKIIESKKVIIVFTALGTKLEIYKLFIKALNLKGYSVVAYDYPARLVLDAELDSYNKLYDAVKVDAYARIKKLKPVHIYTYGVSMGTILANRLTRETSAIHHVAMCMTYGDITANMMQSPATAKTRAAMKAKGFTADDLRESVKHFNPGTNTEALKGKKIWLHQSKRDKILAYSITDETRKSFEAAGLDFIYTESKLLGHYGTGAKNMLSIRKLVEFYNS